VDLTLVVVFALSSHVDGALTQFQVSVTDSVDSAASASVRLVV
jgi:hypothetical protein